MLETVGSIWLLGDAAFFDIIKKPFNLFNPFFQIVYFRFSPSPSLPPPAWKFVFGSVLVGVKVVGEMYDLIGVVYRKAQGF